jgi:hypothetical protein
MHTIPVDVNLDFIGFKSPKSLLDTVSTGSDSDLFNDWDLRVFNKYVMLITDQVAIGPCTDCVQA